MTSFSFLLEKIARHIFGGYVRGSFSQQKQDRFISDILFPNKENGYFIEVGAHDGISISNTYYLEKFREWDGILIEPNPILYKKMKIFRSVNIEKCAISNENGEATFIPDGAVGKIVSEDNKNSHSIRVKLNTLKKILDKNSAPSEIEYLSVDVEGHEENVFHNFPIDSYNFLSISVETPSDKLRNKIEKSGYIKILEIPEIDCIYIKNEMKEHVNTNFTNENWSYLEFKVNALIEQIT